MNLVYHLERAVAAVGDSGPDGKWLIIVDFNGYSMFNAPPIESTRHTIKILQVRATPLHSLQMVLPARWPGHQFKQGFRPWNPH